MGYPSAPAARVARAHGLLPYELPIPPAPPIPLTSMAFSQVRQYVLGLHAQNNGDGNPASAGEPWRMVHPVVDGAGAAITQPNHGGDLQQNAKKFSHGPSGQNSSIRPIDGNQVSGRRQQGLMREAGARGAPAAAFSGQRGVAQQSKALAPSHPLQSGSQTTSLQQPAPQMTSMKATSKSLDASPHPPSLNNRGLPRPSGLSAPGSDSFTRPGMSTDDMNLSRSQPTLLQPAPIRAADFDQATLRRLLYLEKRAPADLDKDTAHTSSLPMPAGGAMNAWKEPSPPQAPKGYTLSELSSPSPDCSAYASSPSPHLIRAGQDEDNRKRDFGTMNEGVDKEQNPAKRQRS